MAKNIQMPFSMAAGSKGYLKEKYLSSCFPEVVVMLILFLLLETSLKPSSMDQFAPMGM